MLTSVLSLSSNDVNCLKTVTRELLNYPVSALLGNITVFIPYTEVLATKFLIILPGEGKKCKIGTVDLILDCDSDIGMSSHKAYFAKEITSSQL